MDKARISSAGCEDASTTFAFRGSRLRAWSALAACAGALWMMPACSGGSGDPNAATAAAGAGGSGQLPGNGTKPTKPPPVQTGTPHSGGGSCGFTFTDSACNSCNTSSCCSLDQACAQDGACSTLLSCMVKCAGDTSCEDSCIQSAPTSAANELNAFLTCVNSSCPVCGGGTADAGPGADAGVDSGIDASSGDAGGFAAPGDPCIVNNDCASGECAGDGVHWGWCTISGCSSNVQCGIDGAGQLVWCDAAGSSYACFPGCNSDADCSSFYCSATGSAALCLSGTSINGASDSVCACE